MTPRPSPLSHPQPAAGPKDRTSAAEALRQAGLLFLFSFFFAVVFNLFYAAGIELKPKPLTHNYPPYPTPPSFTGWPKPTPVPKTHSLPPTRRPSPAPVPDNIVLVSLEGVKNWFDQKSAVFLDARPPEEYQDGHIPGALEFYADDFDKYAPQVLPQLQDKEQKIVCYCHGSSCELSITLAHRLIDLGYTNVKVFFGGWPQWKQAGYPVDKGEAP